MEISMNHVKQWSAIGAMAVTLLSVAPSAGASANTDGATNRDYAAIAQRRQARLQERFEKLKADLRLSPQQEPQWQTFVATVQQQLNIAREGRGQPPQNLTAPERMSRRIALTEQRLVGMQKVQAALNDLYAALTPEQRETMDQQAARHAHFGHRRGAKADHSGRGV